MAAKHLWEVEENKISRDLTGKYVMLYGKPKSGKTTAACSFPDAILLAFEKGYNAIGNIKAWDINNWIDFKMALQDLEDERCKKMFKTVIIDTVSICWDMCERYICSQHSVQKIGDIEWGAGYTECSKEFEKCIRQITKLGYGEVLIAHSASRTEKAADGSDVEIISPALPKRGAEVCNGIVDIIGYIGTEWHEGESKRWLYTRETPTLFAGSRFKYMPAKIPFGYDELVKAIGNAIDEAEKKDGAVITNELPKLQADEALDFQAVRAEAQEVWTKLVGSGENANPEMASTLLKKIEIIMGHRMKLSEFTEDQVDLLNYVVNDMKTLL